MSRTAKKVYDVSSIKEMDAISHIRSRPGMYIGDTSDITKMVVECIDNSIDEAQAGFADFISVEINKDGWFKVSDNGRGIPFDETLPIEKDPPVLICNNIFTSGKFNKEKEESAYKVASGLHGVGLTAVYALSDKMNIEIYKKNKKATYEFNHSGKIKRYVEKASKNSISTIIEVFPHKKYFESFDVDVKHIEDRLKIAVVNVKGLKIDFIIDGNSKNIEGSEEEIITSHLGQNITNWYTIEHTSKNDEYYYLKFGWDEDVNKIKYLSTVNLIPVDNGIHITTINNSFKNVLCSLAKKYNYDFQESDVLSGIRYYINLKLIDPHFEAQVKNKLSRKTNLDIFGNLEAKLKKALESDVSELEILLGKFQDYRHSIENKKVVKISNGKRRSISSFTKLRDCTEPNGELLIGEGDSAVGGLIQVRDTKKQAILPLRGVVKNVLKGSLDSTLKNKEIKEIIQALGCGVKNECDIEKLRYKRIILAADADPAGHFITALLIVLFAHLTPDIIKSGKLYVCNTPLFGYKEKGKLIPIWTDKELDLARKENKHILRFKGLGEFSPNDLKTFTLDKKYRKLEKVEWSENCDRIFELMINSDEKKKLVMGEWSLNGDLQNETI